MLRMVTAVFVFLLLLTSCMYWPTTYSKLIGPGEYFRPGCRGTDNILWFGLNDSLGLMIGSVEKHIGLTVFLGEKHRVRLSKPEVQLVDPHGSKLVIKALGPFKYTIGERFTSKEIAMNYVHNAAAEQEETVSREVRYVQDGVWMVNATYLFPASAEFVGRGGRERGPIEKLLGQEQWKFHAVYLTDLELPEDAPAMFKLRFPAVYLDGMLIEVPEVTVEKVTELVRYTIC